MLNTSCIDLVRMTLNVISWGFRHFDASSLAYKMIKFRARIGLKYLISISVHWTLTEDVFTTFLICSFRPWLRWYRYMCWQKLTNASYNIHLKFKLYHIIAKLRWQWTTNCSSCITTMPSIASKKMYMISFTSIQRADRTSEEDGVNYRCSWQRRLVWTRKRKQPGMKHQ